jgi:hypothetical protein
VTFSHVKLANNAGTVIGVALVWVAFFELNQLVFSQLAHSSRAHWVFLPAALRIMSVLVFGGAGVLGLTFGAFLTLPHDAPWPYELALAVSSGLAPMIAIWLCRQMFPILPDLSGLRGQHIIALSIVGAAANSILIGVCIASSSRWDSNLRQIAAIFVGDMLGTFILLSVISVMVGIILKIFSAKNR